MVDPEDDDPRCAFTSASGIVSLMTISMTLPALSVLLVVIAAWVTLLDRPELAALRGVVLAAVGNVTNWWLIAQHSSYFAQFGPPPPLGHLWSLAVEEQFYLVWALAAVARAALDPRQVRTMFVVRGLATGGRPTDPLCCTLRAVLADRAFEKWSGRRNMSRSARGVRSRADRCAQGASAVAINGVRENRFGHAGGPG